MEMILLKKIDEVAFKKYSKLLADDEDVKKYVEFYSNKNVYGISLENEIIGLIGFHELCGNMVSIDIGIRKEYRNKGYGKELLKSLPEKYGMMFSEFQNFVAFVHYKNTISDKAFENIGWDIVYEEKYQELSDYKVYVKTINKNKNKESK